MGGKNIKKIDIIKSRIDEVAQDYFYRCMTVKELEIKYNCSYSTIQRGLKQSGYKLGNPEQIKYTYIRDNEKEFIKDWEDNELEIYELEQKYHCPASNILSRARELNIKRKSKIEMLNISDIVNDYCNLHMMNKDIIKKYQISESTLEKILHNNCIYDYNHGRKYYFNEKYFDLIDNEHKAYWLGFIYADGSHNTKRYSLSIGLQPGDSYLLEKFLSDIECTRLLTYYYNKKYKKSYPRAYVQHPHLSSTLIKKGVDSDKSFKIRFPSDDIVPYNLKRHFIRGYFDGDGCLCSTKDIKHISYSFIGNYKFLDGLQNFLMSNIDDYKEGIIRKPRKDAKIYIFGHGGRFATQMFLDWLYEDSTIYLERKHDIYKRLLSYNKKECA